MYGNSTDGCLLPSLSVMQTRESRNTIEMNRNGTRKGQQKTPWKCSASLSAPWTQTRCSCEVDSLGLRWVWSLVSILKSLKVFMSCSKNIGDGKPSLPCSCKNLFLFYSCVECVYGAHGGQKNELDFLEPELLQGC